MAEVTAYQDNMRPSRVVVGLSGGVDSAVSALRLVRAGYQVAGLFMKNWEDDDTLLRCSAAEDLEAAERVAAHLGIPLYRVNFAAQYKAKVFQHALDELQAGRTPNPDILCNRYIKFDLFLNYALTELGADYIATGHYARLSAQPGEQNTESQNIESQNTESQNTSPQINHNPDGYGAQNTSRQANRQISNQTSSQASELNKAHIQAPAPGPRQLLRGIDEHKDQSYFLAAIEAQTLTRLIFPLGESNKQQVRAEAQKAGLPNAMRADSTGICFIGERDFTHFMQRYIPTSPGPILTPAGERVGEHRGLAFYTLGQRRGLGIGGQEQHANKPWYVAAKDAARNALIVVQEHDHRLLLSRAVVSEPVSWLAPPPAAGTPLEAQIRYRQSAQHGHLEHHPDGGVTFHFAIPQRAATPGQFLVIYSGERCLGGAAINRTLPWD